MFDNTDLERGDACCIVRFILNKAQFDQRCKIVTSLLKQSIVFPESFLWGKNK